MSSTRSVVLAMTGSLFLFVAAHGLSYVADEANVKRFDNPLDGRLGGVEQFVAWGFVFVTLIVFADFGGGSGELASQFAWLIFIAMLFSYGIGAFGNLRALMGVAEGSTLGDGDGQTTRGGTLPGSGGSRTV